LSGPDLVGDILLLIELTPLGQRVAPRGLELWALDVAQRAVGADIRDINMYIPRLKRGLEHVRASMRAPEDKTIRDHVDEVRGFVHDRLAGELSKRGRIALQTFELALACVEGARSYEQLARTALGAFPAEHERAESEAQARRLLLRCKLVPSSAELLVRLDYAEARGVLPQAPAQREWLEQQRAALMRDDENHRVIITLRYLEQVFLDEFEKAR
jgi:hypothetical protein